MLTVIEPTAQWSLPAPNRTIRVQVAEADP